MMQRLLVIVLLLFAASPVAALEIVYPADKTSIRSSEFLILKGGAPALQAMVVAINDEKSEPIDISAAEYRAAFADMLILQPEFDPGKNSIVVEGLVGGKVVGTAKAEIYYVADPLAAAPENFPPFVMHLPEKEKACAPCHNMNPDQKELAVQGEGNPCASCHKRRFNRKYVHGPVGVWNCVYCHPATTRPAKYQARAGDAQVCQECHAEKVRKFSESKFVHGPVEAGMCSLCHDAHASDQPGQLLAETNSVCYGCHDKVDRRGHVVRGVSGKGHPLEGKGDPLRPGHAMSCVSCHDPHAGQASALFQRGITNRFALCQACHKK